MECRKGVTRESFESFLDGNMISRSILERFTVHDILLSLKSYLKPSEYYFLYYAYLDSERPKISDFDILFGYDQNRRNHFSISLIEKVKNRLKVIEHSESDNINLEIRNGKITPVDLDILLAYFFLKSTLKEDELAFFRSAIELDFSFYDGIRASTADSSMDFVSIYIRLKENFDSLNGERKEEFNYFVHKARKKYGLRLCNMSLDKDLERALLDYKMSSGLWDRLPKEEAYEIVMEKCGTLFDDLEFAIESYFDVNREEAGSILDAEREMNLIRFGFLRRNDLPIDVLCQTAITNKDRFTSEEYNYLMAFRFFKISQKKFLKRYPNSRLLKSDKALMDKLEDMCLNISDYGRGVSPNKAKDKRNKGIDPNIYVNYISNPFISFTPLERCLLGLCLVKNESYEEIGRMYSLDKSQISETLMSAIHKIDFYRFGIIKPVFEFTNEDYEYILSSPNFLEKEKRIIRELRTGNLSFICQKYRLNENEINCVLKKIYDSCLQKRLKFTYVSVEDIIEDIDGHPYQSVLGDRAKRVLSLHLGLTNRYNSSGKIYTYGEIERLYPELGISLGDVYAIAMEKLKKKKMGLTRGTFAYMTREEVAILLEDKRLPINPEDKEILGYAFGLCNYPYKSPDRLAEFYGCNINNLRRRIQRIFLTLFKYREKEIPGAISYELDVFPNLRYFTLSDRKILKSFYHDRMSYGDIAKSYGLSYDQVTEKLRNLTNYLGDILERKAVPFDFSYYKSIPEANVSFNGDIKFAKRLFNLYYEEQKTIREIRDELNLECSNKTVMRQIDALKRAYMKRKVGILATPKISYRDIRDFYLKNKDEMDVKHKDCYYKFFKQLKKKSGENVDMDRQFSINEVSKVIICDILQSKNVRSYLRVQKLSRKRVIKFLREHLYDISSQSREALMSYFNISRRDIMDYREKERVLKLLSTIDVKPLDQVEEKKLEISAVG